MKKIRFSYPDFPDTKNFQKYLNKINKSRYLSNFGPILEKYEQEVAAFLNVDNVSSVSNATLGILLSIKLLAKKDKKIIVTTAYSFPSICQSIKFNNYKIKFVDIEKDYVNIDYNEFNKIDLSKVACVVLTNMYGNIPKDFEKIYSKCKKNNVSLIYDIAANFGVKYFSNFYKYGDAFIISTHATKIFNTLEGGIVFFKNSKNTEIFKDMINFGRKKDGEFFNVYHEGLNAKMNEVQASIGLINLKSINKSIRIRKSIADHYDKEFKKYPNKFSIFQYNVKSNFSFYPLIIVDKKINILEIHKNLLKKNITTYLYSYPSLNKNTFFKTRDKLPITDSLSKKILCLPIHSNINYKDIKIIVNAMLCLLIKK